MSVPPWPLAIITGALGAGKTTLIRRMFTEHPAPGTLVIVNEFGEVGLDHLLLRAVTNDIVLLANGCLCCQVRQDLVRTLCDIRRDWLAGHIDTLARVLIETSGVAEPAPLVSSLLTHPLLAEAFSLKSLVAVVDGEYGARGIAANATTRAQACLADRLVLSKTDRCAAAPLRALETTLHQLNPLARAETSASIDLESCFERTTDALPASGLSCDDPDHLGRVSTLILYPRGTLHWPEVQGWLGSMILAHGDHIPRIKGCLAFAGFEHPVVIQAVHHTFYPLETLPDSGPGAGLGLVVLHELESLDDIVTDAANVGLVTTARQTIVGL